MAENNQRSYRDLPPLRSVEEAAEKDDPLAELARLIGQSVPMNKSGPDRRSTAPQIDRREIERAARYATSDEVLQEPGDEPDLAAPPDGRYGEHSRHRQEPDFAIERARDRSYGDAHETAYDETAEWDGQSSGQHDDDYQDDYEDERRDAHHDDDGYGDEHDADRHSSRRGGFVFVAAVFALAVLGTAGAFGYRAMFGAPAMPALPPIIKAESGPNKIIPKDANSQDTATRQADATNTGSGERLVSREERPVDITPPIASTAPRTVSTVPVFPDPPSMGGPGAIVGYGGNPTASSPAMSAEPPAPAAPPITTATAPNPAPSSSQITLASPATVAPIGTTSAPAAPGMPAASAPKKIRTVTIHTDPSGAPDSPAGASASASPRPAAQPAQAANGGNAPLSIVPSATEQPPAAPARPRPAPAQPAPLNKPLANETASAAPAAPAAAGGSYAVQVSSQRSEAEAQSSFRDLQAKYSSVLGGREPIIRRADLGAKGIYFRAMVGPFTSSDQASELCSNLKAAGGSCIVQKN